jgi:carbon monoxide dehydrogenase subunit G
MKIAGGDRIAAPRDKVWEALNDPEILRQCIPGCQSLEKEGSDRLRAIVEVKIGPIGARFSGAVTLSNINPLHGYTLAGEGQAGVAGSAKGTARVQLAEDGNGTLLSYEVESEVSGRLAQLGGPLIDSTAKRLSGLFFQRFGALVGAPPAAVAAETVRSAPLPKAAAPQPPVSAAAPSSHGLPIAWILAVALAALAGFLVGRGQGGGASDWTGLAIGLLVIIVAAAGFEYGRRAAAPQLVLDAGLLRRLLREESQP